MIRRRHPSYPPVSGISGNDTDALQTDVMRFLSILGLCLMAVFALVQSIPLPEAGRPPPKPDTTHLQREIRLQQERVPVLQGELQRLNEDIAAATARQAGAVQAASAAETQLTRVRAQTRQAQEQRERAAGELQELEQQLRQSRRELERTQQATLDQTRSLQTLRQRLRQAQQQLDRVEQRMQALREDPPPVPVEIVKEPPADPGYSAKEPSPSPTPVRHEPGFTLRFASAAALDRLVAAGTVRLYGMRERKAWRLSLNGGRPAFAPVAFPEWFHEMAPATVPPAYVRALQRTVTAPAAAATLWGVQLPAATRQDITALTREHTGGTLVIRADGQVALERE